MTGKTTYSDEIADQICEMIGKGVSLASICKMDGMPVASTVYKWLSETPAFSERYVRAREVQADTLFDEILDIADSQEGDIIKGEDGKETVNHDVINRAKLRIDARKWMAAKLQPKKYGDKLDIDQKTTLEASDPLTMLLMQIADSGRKITDKP